MKTDGLLLIPIRKTPPVSLSLKMCVSIMRHPCFPASRASRYNTLHLCSKGCVPKGGLRPLWKPLGFVGAWPHFAFLIMRPILQNRAKKKRISAHPSGRYSLLFMPPVRHTQPEKIAALFINRNGNLQSKLSEIILDFWVVLFV